MRAVGAPNPKPSSEYDILEHRRRFAAWAASRAASVKGCRFSAEQGRAILERAELRQLIADPKRLPDPDPSSVDGAHERWRQKVIEIAQRDFLLPFTHGVAAKLINMYLKAAFVCGGHEQHERVRHLHPPVDGLLLDSLARATAGGEDLKNVWTALRDKRWSRFDAEHYKSAILAIRRVVGDQPLWTIEAHWRGYQ